MAILLDDLRLLVFDFLVRLLIPLMDDRIMALT
jgi:hypothetical protein